MRTDLAWGFDSGTHELPRVARGIPLAEQPTTELLLPLRPELPRTRRTLTTRVRATGLIAAATLGAGIAHLLAVTS